MTMDDVQNNFRVYHTEVKNISPQPNLISREFIYVSYKSVARRHYRVVSILAFYLGGPGFIYRPKDRKS